MILRELKSVVFELLSIPISSLIPDDRRCASSLVIWMLVEVRLKVLWPFLLIAECHPGRHRIRACGLIGRAGSNSDHDANTQYEHDEDEYEFPHDITESNHSASLLKDHLLIPKLTLCLLCGHYNLARTL